MQDPFDMSEDLTFFLWQIRLPVIAEIARDLKARAAQCPTWDKERLAKMAAEVQRVWNLRA